MQMKQSLQSVLASIWESDEFNRRKTIVAKAYNIEYGTALRTIYNKKNDPTFSTFIRVAEMLSVRPSEILRRMEQGMEDLDDEDEHDNED